VSIFDWTFQLGPAAVSPHVALESLAYLIAFEVYRRERRARGDFLASEVRSSVVVAAIVGAAHGRPVLAAHRRRH